MDSSFLTCPNQSFNGYTLQLVVKKQNKAINSLVNERAMLLTVNCFGAWNVWTMNYPHPKIGTMWYFT